MENIFFIPNKFADPPIFQDPIDLYPLPPIWIDPGGGPVKDDPKNPIYDDPIKFPPQFRSYDYFGQVRGAYTELPLPGATVTIYKNGAKVAQQAADRNGNFQITLNEPADAITISEVSHKTFNWPASEVQHFFDLEPNIVDIDPVILPPGTHPPKNNYLIWLIVAAIIAKSQKWI